jgi:serine/threonine protein phosphatase 1
VAPRTFAIGDIHGERAALDALLARLPPLTADDTLVFMGDYCDRGPDSRGVIERVRRLVAEGPARVVTLRGNHEDMWLECWSAPSFGFLLPRGNGTVNTFRSFTGGDPVREDEDISSDEVEAMCDVRSWLPADVHAWMGGLALYYEDEHALYVHAGLERSGPGWKHPRDSSPRHLMWMRDPSFFRGYQGKRLVFGHTPTRDLEPPSSTVWQRGDLIGIDTAAGKGGFLSALELPSLTVYESRAC